jgi:hypothetical protein
MSAVQLTTISEIARRAAMPLRTRTLALEGLYLVGLPIVAVAVLGISVIDQEGYVDPEFYTGYGQSFETMWEVFGLTYYSARFPIMFVNTTSQWLWPGLGGYSLLRLLVLLLCGIPLYTLARRHYGRPVAMASYAFLVLNPLLLRILCWDLTTFLSIPAGFAGITLWHLSSRAWSRSVLAAGFLFGVSVNSHVFTGTAIAVFLAVELVFAARRGRGLSWFVPRVVTLAAGGLLCLLLGLAFYAVTVGPVSPLSLWRITTHAVTAGRTYAVTNYVTIADYYATNYEIYVPILTTAAALLLNRRRLMIDTIEAHIIWFATMYLAAYIVAVFILRMNIVQYFWYFGHLTIAVYLSVPVVLARLVERAGSRATTWFLAALAAVPIAVASWADLWRSIVTAAHGNGTIVGSLAAAMLITVVVLQVRRPRMVLCATTSLALLLQVPYLSQTHASVFDVHDNVTEAPLFETIMRYRALLNRYDRAGARVRTWYRYSDAMGSIASSNLLFTLQPPWGQGGMPVVAETEKANLAEPSLRYVLLVDPQPERVNQGLDALRAAGVGFTILEQQTWGRDPRAFRAVLVRLER